MGEKKERDLEAEREELITRLKVLVPEDLRIQIEQAMSMTASSPEFIVRVSRSGAFDANPE
jgi:hypothetical protein